MKNILKKQILIKGAFIPHLKKWVFPPLNHNIKYLYRWIIYPYIPALTIIFNDEDKYNKPLASIYFVDDIDEKFIERKNNLLSYSGLPVIYFEKFHLYTDIHTLRNMLRDKLRDAYDELWEKGITPMYDRDIVSSEVMCCLRCQEDEIWEPNIMTFSEYSERIDKLIKSKLKSGITK